MILRATAAALVGATVLVGCGGDDTTAPIDCSDPYGGFLNGSITSPSGELIELGPVDGTPAVVHYQASGKMPELTGLHLESRGVLFSVAVEGPVTMSATFPSGSIYGNAYTTELFHCPPLTPGALAHATGRVMMTFNGSSIEGWFNGTAEDR